MSDVKRQKLGHESSSYIATSDTFCEAYQRHLLDISDDVLLNVLSHLSGSDLYSLSRTCERFHTLCQDRTLWEVADFRRRRMRVEELGTVMHLLQPHTKFLAIRGFADVTSRTEAGILPKRFLSCLPASCPHLETFIVEDFFIDVDKVDCRDFPRMVRCLSLKGCQVVDSAKVRCLSADKSHFFLQVYVHLPNLEKLVLSYCRWFRLHSLMAISKCANLVELRLDGIRHLHDNVPYLSLATSFGFRKLKILDMRNTTVGSSAMRGFNNLLNLTHLYLECPPQYRQKETSIPVPSTSQHCPESSDEDCEEVNLMQGHENSCVIVLRFGGSPEVWHNKKCVNDCCSNGEQSKILHVRQNLNQGEGTSKQEDGSGSSGTTMHHKVEQHAPTSSQKVSTEAGTKNSYKISIDVENVNAEGTNAGNDENCEDSVIYVRNAINTEQSKPVAQKQTEMEGIKMDIKIDASANAGASRADAGNSFHTDKSTDTIAGKSSGEGKSPSDEKEHENISSSEFVHCDIGGIADKTMDESVRDEALRLKPSYTCEGERKAEGSESSDDTSDDEANSEGNCRQSGSRSRPGKKSCSGRLRSVELFSSARNAKCARTSCLGGRHEELIDDLSIDYFLSRDMWRVSLDGNIVRCNDRSPQLHTLVIRYYPHVTDKTLNLLHRISSLRYIDVTGTKVTEKGVEWFRRMRPDVTVVSDFGASQ